MKILIDFREGAATRRAGKGEYARQLVLEMVKQVKDAELILLTYPGQTLHLPKGNWRQKAIGGGKILWHLWVWLWCEIAKPADVYFASTSAIVPALLRRMPVVMTIFDFTVWRFPATHLSHAVRLEKIFLPLALKSAKHLLAISDFTRQEAQALFRVPAHKVTTTLLGVNEHYRPVALKVSTKKQLKKRYKLPDNFVLYLGTLEPRKNLPILISAFQSLKSQFPDTRLVLAGSLGWQSQQLQTLLTDDIVVTGFIRDADQVAVYNLAQLFVFPSLYEGFGMPPLEAMACGVPTIVSNQASLPEVVGSAAIQVPPTQTDKLTDAIKRILSSPNLQRQLSRAGRKRALEFSWRSTAQKTLEILKRYG
ncbi:MAG: glycosyltransferase family 1 protein [Patescibacteria group bacterium]|nr:glycosyltransferase family 1 protein [Patescibacteria group bacterium]